MAEANRVVLYKAGEVILQGCDALVKCLDPSLRDTRCYNCFEPIDTPLEFNCVVCKLVNYCKRSCKVDDWHSCHRIECKFMNTPIFREFIDDRTEHVLRLFLLRIFSFLKIHPEMADREFPALDGSSQSMNSVAQLTGNLVRTDGRIDSCRDMAERLTAVDPRCGANGEDLLKWLCSSRLWFPIYSDDCSTTLGCGIFVQPSVLNHSCIPNAVIVNIGNSIQIRAIAPIKTREQPLISYVDIYSEMGDRQRLLKEHFNINCECFVCRLETVEPAIDYRRLNFLVNKMIEYKRDPSSRPGWNLIFEQHLRTLRLLRGLLRDFDSPITQQYTRALEIGIDMAVDRMELEDLRQETHRHLKISYGEQHPWTLKFKSVTEPYFNV